MKHKILVKCTFEIPVEVDDYDNPDYNIDFDIMENHCPGTSHVGAAFDERYEKATKEHFCWACGLKGTSEIIDYDYHETNS